MPKDSSLIIATYNWPAALSCCLESILAQSVFPDEIIIADDGSDERTRVLIKQFQSKSPVPVIHVWQPDEGFQLAKIRNKAVAVARFEYIIQIDGDLILHQHFIKDHLSAAKRGRFIGGSRCLLTAPKSDEILKNKSIDLFWLQKGLKNRENAIRFKPVGYLLQIGFKTNSTSNIRGCNMSFWRSDFILVNGYNEAYSGWGKEDTDLVIRFMNCGLLRYLFKFQGIVFHIWHTEASRSDLEKNEKLLEILKSIKVVRCEVGIDQYLKLLV
jgi:glycosyltransferase involved in cell wall biosynthesis